MSTRLDFRGVAIGPAPKPRPRRRSALNVTDVLAAVALAGCCLYGIGWVLVPFFADVWRLGA